MLQISHDACVLSVFPLPAILVNDDSAKEC